MKYINQFRENDQVIGIYLCKQKTYAQTKNGKEYINLIMADKTGQISSKIWDTGSGGIGDFEANDYLEIHGRVSVFNNALQLTIDRAMRAAEGSYDPSEYLPKSSRDIEEMYAEILDFVNSVKSPYFKLLLESFFKDDADFIKEFKSHSAAKSVHHSFMGGLLQHTGAVARLCDFYCQRYPILNRDLLITGALLHDVGKVKELAPFPANDYTDAGQLLGHIVMGVEMIDEKLSQIKGFPEKRARELKHLILAHHGEYEFGSPKKPALIEAVALNMADNTDAKLQSLTDLFDSRAQMQTGDSLWLGFNKIFDSNIRLTDKRE